MVALVAEEVRLLCEEEAQRFAVLAERCWHKADPGALQAELQFLRSQGTVETPKK